MLVCVRVGENMGKVSTMNRGMRRGSYGNKPRCTESEGWGVGGWGGRGHQDILLFRVGIFEWPLQSTTETEY